MKTRWITTLALLAFASALRAAPNILWIVVDDMSAHFACYGETAIQTPAVDRLAREGARFSRAYVTAPVCSPCRSALITGMYQTSIGAHHHRSGRGPEKIQLPAGVEPAPVLFGRAGYHTSNCDWPPRERALAKTDYNFEWDPQMYDGNDWAGRKPGQPFFAQVQLHGGKARGANGAGQNVRRALGELTPPEKVELPPYYPDDPIIRADWAAYLDTVRFTDLQVGQIVQRLEQEGILDETVIFFITDHGISHARGKQFLYDEGMHIPFVVRGPGIPRGQVREDLVEHIDLAAASLALAGLPVPPWMQARDIFANSYRARDAVFAARDRCDETVEGIRAVRTDRWKYIRNFYPDRPHLQPNRYKDNKHILRRLRTLHEDGRLDPLVERLLFASNRAPEELYDLRADPFETVNLASAANHGETLLKLRQRLDVWMERTGDQGRHPEPVAMYESDMGVYVGSGPAQSEELRRNIELMNRWRSERPLRVQPGDD